MFGITYYILYYLNLNKLSHNLADRKHRFPLVWNFVSQWFIFKKCLMNYYYALVLTENLKQGEKETDSTDWIENVEDVKKNRS